MTTIAENCVPKVKGEVVPKAKRGGVPEGAADAVRRTLA